MFQLVHSKGFSKENGLIKKLRVQQMQSKLGNSVDITFEEIDRLVPSKTFV
jgi:hypothetical protein